MNIAFIGKGAMTQFAAEHLEKLGHKTVAYIVRPGKRPDPEGPICVTKIADLPAGIDRVIDCAGHQALATHGVDALRSGLDVITVSLGALADAELERQLLNAARQGKATLTLVPGAIGGLDALRSARVGGLQSVRYVGRKPPKGWKGSPAENTLDLDSMTDVPATHFQGSARAAANAYPKNANVAAAVALAGIGLDDTVAELIADPTVTSNIHEVFAKGDFGQFTFRVEGEPLPDNPKTSALAAMSVVSAVCETENLIRF